MAHPPLHRPLLPSSAVLTKQLDDTAKTRVLQQVEFYFSDSNAPRDPFLFSRMRDDPEGYVDIAVVCSFSRMQLLLYAGATGRIKAADVPPATVSEVAAILGTSKQLEVDSAGQRVRRTSPLDPETAMAEVDARSIYAKPFPFDVTLDGLMQFWNTVAPTRGVRLRRHAVSLDFKGSIFVEFDCCATADQVLGKALEHAGAALVLEPKVQFLQKKALERKAKAETAAPAAAEATAEPAGKEAAAAAAPAPAADSPSADGASEQPSTSASFIPGSVLRVHLAGGGALPDFATVREALGGRDAGIRFVEVVGEDADAFARFGSAEEATAALQTAKDGDALTMGGRQAEVSVLEGEAEQQFAARQAQKFQKAQAEGGRGRKRPHDGQGPSRGRGRGRRGRGRS